MILEICAQSYQAAINAANGGADRLELCSHLGGGGITPSLGLLAQVKKEINIPIFVLIRPRPGHFYYSSGELTIMVKDIKVCVDAGADGIVSGCLTRENLLDIPSIHLMLNAAQGLQFTFHRAFEQIKDASLALNQLIDLGVSRILTGGSTGHAYESRYELRNLQTQAGSRLNILAGSGVTPHNLSQLIIESQVREVHSSAKYSSQIFKSTEVDPFDSDPEIVKELVSICRSFTAER